MLFSLFSLGMPEPEQIRADVQLISDREYSKCVYFIYMDKNKGEKILGLHRSTGNSRKLTAKLPKKKKKNQKENVLETRAAAQGMD